jgi:hypothetical protein
MSLTAGQVSNIMQNAVATAQRTRAQIRLPLGTRASMAISVADFDGRVLGVYRMPDSTIFSIDVAVTKARNVVYFSGPGRGPRDLPGLPMHDRIRRAKLLPIGNLEHAAGTVLPDLPRRPREPVHPRASVRESESIQRGVLSRLRASIATANWLADSACRAMAWSRTITSPLRSARL